MAEYYVFQGLTTNWCQWYRPVVWRFAFVSLLKNRCYMSRFFQSSGTLPLSSDVWKIRVSDGVIDVPFSLKKRVDSWSGPVALCGLRLRSSFRTPSFPTIIFGASGVLLMPKFGMVLVPFSLVKTEENCSFKSSAFSDASACLWNRTRLRVLHIFRLFL